MGWCNRRSLRRWRAQQEVRVRFVGWDAQAGAVVRPALEQVSLSLTNKVDSPKMNPYELALAFEHFELVELRDYRIDLQAHQQAECLLNEMLFQNCTITKQVEVLSTETPEQAQAPKYTFLGCTWPRQSIPQTFRVQGANLCIQSCHLTTVHLTYGSLMENSSVSHALSQLPSLINCILPSLLSLSLTHHTNR